MIKERGTIEFLRCTLDFCLLVSVEIHSDFALLFLNSYRSRIETMQPKKFLNFSSLSLSKCLGKSLKSAYGLFTTNLNTKLRRTTESEIK